MKRYDYNDGARKGPSGVPYCWEASTEDGADLDAWACTKYEGHDGDHATLSSNRLREQKTWTNNSIAPIFGTTEEVA